MDFPGSLFLRYNKSMAKTEEVYDPFILKICASLYEDVIVKLEFDDMTAMKKMPGATDGKRIIVRLNQENRVINVYYDYGGTSSLNSLHYITFNEIEEWILSNPTETLDNE